MHIREKIFIAVFFIVSINAFCYERQYAPPHSSNAKKMISSKKSIINGYREYDKVGKRAVGNSGGGKILVLPIEFKDLKHRTIRDTVYFTNLLFSENKGSMKDYYKEVSYGKFTFSGTVLDWVSSDYNVGKYSLPNGENGLNNIGSGDNDIEMQNLIKEAIEKNSAKINFADYDDNKDGILDHLIIVHAGQAEEYSGDINDLWSHRGELSFLQNGSERLFNGIKIRGYTLLSEESPVGIFSHEFAHDLGVPDLYDTVTGNSIVGMFSLMDHGSWNGINTDDGTSPAHFSCWEKIFLGFEQPIKIQKVDNNKTFSIASNEINYTNGVYKIELNNEGTEYLLLENRQKVGYDIALPGSGILIYHIFEGENSGTTLKSDIISNSVNNNYYLKRIKILEADTNNGIGKVLPDKTKVYGESGDFFSGNGNSQLNSNFDNLVNTCAWNGNSYKIETGHKIQNISSPGDIMEFKYYFTSPYDFNGDGKVDAKDIITYKASFGSNAATTGSGFLLKFDYNEDKKIDSKDLLELKKRMQKYSASYRMW